MPPTTGIIMKIHVNFDKVGSSKDYMLGNLKGNSFYIYISGENDIIQNWFHIMQWCGSSMARIGLV